MLFSAFQRNAQLSPQVAISEVWGDATNKHFCCFGNCDETVKIRKVVFTSNLSTNSAIMVNGGLAYSLVIEGSVPFWDQSKVTYRPLDPSLTATSVLAWKRGQPFSSAATKFIEHIQCFLGISKP